MANELTINSLGDVVRDKVKAAIFTSIPDEAVQILLEKEFENLTKIDQWNKKSELQTLILAEIKRQATVRVTESVSKYLDETFSSNSKELVNAAIKELAPIFMAGMTENFAQAAVQQLRNQLCNRGINL